MSGSSNSASAAAPARQPDPAQTLSPERACDRELSAMLQLLAERARFITGASTVAIAMDQDNQLVCRATAGSPSASQTFPLNSGFIREAVRSKQILSCDVGDRESPIAREDSDQTDRSVMVAPLLSDDDVVIGVVELRSGRIQAFEEQDATAMARVAEVIVTAVENASAAKRIFDELSYSEIAGDEPELAVQSADREPAVLGVEPAVAQPELPESDVTELKLATSVRTCPACGFPISDGRAVCLDCEEAGKAVESPSILNQTRDENWLQAHAYTIGAFLIFALTIAWVMLKFK